jgi:hypothetical protein
LDKASVAATVVVGLLILGAMFYTYAQTSSEASSLSSQNARLSAQNLVLQSEIANQQSVFQQQISSIGRQVSTLEQRTLTVVTLTETYVSIETTVSTTSLTSTSTVSVYPIPDNVTVLFIAGYLYSYSITAGSVSLSGSGGGSFNHNSTQSIPIAPVFQGETISITVNLNSPTFACNGNVWVQLLVNGQVVANGSQYCGDGQGVQITYIL